MPVKDQWSCPFCGSTNVESLCLVWYDTNKDEPNLESEVSLAENYDHFYCNDCKQHPGMLDCDQVEAPPPAEKYPHYVTIRFGLDGPDGVDIDPEDVIEDTFRFETKRELDAFMNGIEEGVGWLGHRVEEDSRKVNNGGS